MSFFASKTIPILGMRQVRLCDGFEKREKVSDDSPEYVVIVPLFVG